LAIGDALGEDEKFGCQTVSEVFPDFAKKILM